MMADTSLTVAISAVVALLTSSAATVVKWYVDKKSLLLKANLDKEAKQFSSLYEERAKAMAEIYDALTELEQVNESVVDARGRLNADALRAWAYSKFAEGAIPEEGLQLPPELDLGDIELDNSKLLDTIADAQESLAKYRLAYKRKRIYFSTNLVTFLESVDTSMSEFYRKIGVTTGVYSFEIPEVLGKTRIKIGEEFRTFYGTGLGF